MKKEGTEAIEVPKRKRRDILFILSGLFLLCICGYFFFASISFLGTSVDSALGESKGVENIPAFDIDGLRKLGILKTEQNSTTPLPTPTPSTQNTSSPISTSSASLP